VAGGGVALLNAIEALKDIQMDNQDAQIGVNIVRQALTANAP
jgi:chaperonin GroEL